MRRLQRILLSKFFLIPAISLVLYALLGYLAAPFALRWYAPKYAREQLQCEASLDKVYIDPFRMIFEANGFNLLGPDGAKLTGFERLFFDFEVTSLFRWKAMFREVRLEKPAIHIAFEQDGSINLTKLVPKSEGEKPLEEKPVAPSESKAPGILLESIVITEGEVSITDRRQSAPVDLTFQDLNLDLKALSTMQDQDGVYSLKAKTSDGEMIEWQGDICLSPFRSSGKIAFSGIQAATLWRFVQDSVRLDSPQGKLDLRTDYRLDAKETLQVALSDFRVDLSSVSLRLSGAEELFFELNKLEVECASMDLAARALQVSRVLVDGGALRVRVDEAGQVNVQQIVHKKQGQEVREETKAVTEMAAQQPSGDAPPWKVSLDAIQIKDFALDVLDRSRAAPLHVGISGISLSSKARIEAGRKVEATVEELSTELKNVRVGSKEAPPLFEAGLLSLEGGGFDLGSRAITVSRVGLSNGRLDLVREGDGKINLAHLFASKNAVPADPVSEPSKGNGDAPWKFLLKAFDLSNFNLALSDFAALPQKPLYNLQNIAVRVTDIDGKSPMGLELGFGVEQGGKLALQGKVDPTTKAVEANVKVADLNLAPLQPYLAPFITLTLQSAVVSTEGAFRYGVPEKGSNLSYGGSFILDKLSLNEPGSREAYLGWDSMKIPKIRLALEPNKLQIDEIRLSKPVGRLLIAEDRTVNLAKIVKERPAGEKSSVSSEGAPKKSAKKVSTPSAAPRGKTESSFPFDIGKVRIEDGNMVFADFSIRPKFMARIHSLKGFIGKLSSEKKTVAEIRLDGRVDQYGMAKVIGNIDLNDFKRSTDINVVFRNVEMASVTPYSGRFAGRKIKSGKLSMDLKYQIQDTKLVGDNKIIVDNLVLGERVESPDAVNLPLDLAIALLSDSNGRIDLGLPVSGDLNDPQFKIGPLVWKVFVNVITKAVTAPFRALGSLFGAGEEKFDVVQFEAGSAELIPPEREKLKKVADALQKRPQLKLKVRGRYSPEVDGLEFKQLAVRRSVAAGAEGGASKEEYEEMPDLADSKTRSALEKLFVQRFGEKALDEIEQAVKRGEIKPSVQDDSAEKQKGKKPAGLFGKIKTVKFYKVIPGAKSPEEKELIAGELYSRLVESEPVSDTALQQLAGSRAQAISADLQSALGVPAERLVTEESEPLAEEAGLSAGLSLDARSAVP